ncbi:MAG: glycosyltransferase, partial [Firmicutes bacterium]|nr:glycosyltransferase [Bacillota bacterium]
MLSDIRKTIDYARRNGLTAAAAAAAERLSDRADTYRYIPATSLELGEQKVKSRRWKEEGRAPLISVVVPRHETPPEFLSAMRASVKSQSYGSYELIETEEAGFSDNINAGVSRASGEYIGILDHDDVLTPDALFCMAQAVIEEREAGR